MSNQSIKMLNARNKNNSRSHKSLKKASQTSNNDIEGDQPMGINKQNGHDIMNTTMVNGKELFTRLAYCQALLYKAWVEAADDLTNKVTKTKANNLDNSKDLTSLYIDTFEEKFTNLFKSPEFASNLCKLLNALMQSIREKDNISKIFLNTLPKTADLENNAASKMGMVKQWRIKL